MTSATSKKSTSIADEPAPLPNGTMALADQPAPILTPALTPAQRTFKRLIEEIEKIENRQQELGGLLDTFRSLFAAKLHPLQDERDMIHRALVLFLDAQLVRDGWSQFDRSTMRQVLCKMAELLFGGKYHDEMEVLFDRHSEVSLADRTAEQKRELAEDLEAAFGVDMKTAADSEQTPEEMLREALRQREADEAAGAQAVEASAVMKRNTRKSARVREEEKQALDAGNLLKQIYRKLTSALHPDRETDHEERLRKTALMTEVNKAYADGNLLKLLHLQWEALKIEARAAGAMADDKLKVINQTLAKQRDELKVECRELETMIREKFHLPPTGALTMASLQKALKSQAANARIGNGNLRHDLTSIRHSRAEFKIWLGVQREWLDEEDSLDEFLSAVSTKARR